MIEGSNEMPQRPFQHRLEAESCNAFSSILPKGWILRPMHPDYGIDYEVELFNMRNVATGRLFKAQIKGTGTKKLNRALAVRLKLSACNYYRSLDLPVLVVRYHSTSEKLYARWFHTFDPYYGREGKKTITFRFTSADEITAENIGRFALDVEAFKRFKSVGISPPFSFYLKFSDPEIHNVPAAQIAFEIRKKVAKISGWIAIKESQPPSHAHPSIIIGNDKTVVDIAGLSSSTLHTSHGYPRDKMGSSFPCDILILVAISLGELGHYGIASQIITEVSENSCILSSIEVTLRVANCLVRAGRILEIFKLAEILSERKESAVAAEMLMLLGMVEKHSLEQHEEEYFQQVMRRHIDRKKQSQDVAAVATAFYNFGNHLRSSGRLRLAFHHYREAAKYDPGYLKRKYFWRELGGTLFEKKHYRFSAIFYKRAIELGEGGETKALYADALMFAGRYRDAMRVFETYFSISKTIRSEWVLKHWVLASICESLGLEEQRRRADKAFELSGRKEEDLSSEKQRSELQKALILDALCGLAWFNLGVTANKKGNKKDAFISFLISAVLTRYDVESWVNAIVLLVSSDENRREYQSLFRHILVTAQWFNSEGLFEQLVKFADAQPEGFPKTEFLNGLNLILDETKERELSIFTIRILGDGAVYEEITAPLDEGQESPR